MDYFTTFNYSEIPKEELGSLTITIQDSEVNLIISDEDQQHLKMCLDNNSIELIKVIDILLHEQRVKIVNRNIIDQAVIRYGQKNNSKGIYTILGTVAITSALNTIIFVLLNDVDLNILIFLLPVGLLVIGFWLLLNRKN